MELILVKENYFRDIIQYYSGHNQFLLAGTEGKQFDIHQPHQFDKFDTIDTIVTKYYPQQ